MSARKASTSGAVYVVAALAVLLVVGAVFLLWGSGRDDSASPEAPRAAQKDHAAVPASARMQIPSPTGPPDEPANANPDAMAIAHLARAWSTGNGWTKAIGAEGLEVTIGDGPSMNVTAEALARVRTSPPPSTPSEDCPEADLNQTAGDPFLEAYFARDVVVRSSPSNLPSWGSWRCYRFDAPTVAGVRVCVKDEADGVRVRALQTAVSEGGTGPAAFDRLILPAAQRPVVSTTAKTDVEAYNVVLLEAGDSLNARSEPDPQASVVYSFASDAREIIAAGKTVTKGTTRWIQLQTPNGPGWVKRHFVARQRTPEQMQADGRFAARWLELTDTMAAAGTPKLGARGLYIMYFGDPIRVTKDSWSQVTAGSRKFNGAACEECVEGSLQKIAVEALTDVLRDANSQQTFGEFRRGPNSSWSVPPAFSGFNVVTVFDPQDTDCTGYDWTAVAFLFDVEDDEPTLVAVGFDAWSP